MVVERAEAGAERGAVARGSLAAIAATSSRCDTHDWSDDPSQLIRCMREALDRADASPADVAVVFASANSSRRLDQQRPGLSKRSSGRAVFPSWP